MPQQLTNLIFQLQFGDAVTQNHALVELKKLGMEEKMLLELKRSGTERKKRMMLQASSNTSTIKAVPIPTPLFVSDHLGTGTHLSKRSLSKPSQANVHFTNTNYISPQSPKFHPSNGENLKLMPIAQLGLSVIGSGADIVLKVKNYDLLKETFDSGKFIANYNGKKVWKMAFKGNASVSSELVAIERVAFNATFKTLKLVKNVGAFSTVLGVYLSYEAAQDQKSNSGWTKFGMDVIMTGVAFIPPFGWVVSGVYGIAGGVLDVAGIDWWGNFWTAYIVNSEELLKEAVSMYDKLNQAHRKVSGKGLFSGQKL